MTKLGRLGELSAWAISGVAWALSFAAQMQLAGAHGFAGWEVWAWPATTDLAGLTGMLIALDQARRNGSTVVAWLIAIAAAAVMVAANVGAYVGDPVAMLLHAWPPSIALASWYLLVHVRRGARSTIARGRTADRLEDRNPVPTRLPARATVRRQLARRGSALTVDDVVAKAGISRRRAAALLREERRPRAVEAER
jgi:small-conductance mechanosensitive channel